MNTKQIFGYIGLGLVSAMIITVVILSFVTVKLSPVFDEPTAQISIYKYNSESGTTYKYNLITDDITADTEKRADYNSVLNEFNGLGSYTVMQSLFLGLTGADTSITSATASYSSLKQSGDGYFIELVWNDSQTLKNLDGSDFLDSNEATVTYKAIGIFVQDVNEITEYKVYVAATRTSSSYKAYYTSYSNVQGLYDIASAFDTANKINATA